MTNGRGRLMQIGTPRALYTRPANLFVAGFIGSPNMNLIACEMAGPRAVTIAGGARVELPAAPPRPATVLGIRPEALRPVAPEAGLLAGEVELVEYLGNDATAFVDAAAAGRIAVRVPAETRLAQGSHVGLGFASDACHLFDEAGTALTATTAPG